jgi:hypothetical protein
MEKDSPRLPGHEQAAAFRVGAIVATQAITVYIEPERPAGPYDVPCEFDRLPARLKIAILAACEEEFKHLKQRLIREGATPAALSETRPSGRMGSSE